MSAKQYFDGTCEGLYLRDCPDKLQDAFLDPCSCKGYWRCTNTFSTMYISCPDTTLYDYKSPGICSHKNFVSVTQPCREGVDTWMRCNDTVSAARLLELQAYCTNTTITTEGMTAATPTSSSDPSSGVNVGMVVGPIIAGAVAAFVIIALVIMCRHRQSKLRRTARRTSSTSLATSSDYVEGRIADDSNAVIDDIMNDPQNNGNSNAGFLHDLSETMSTTTTTLPHEDRSIYDDSVAPIDNYGYTSPLAREKNDEQEPYDRLATISENEANSAASANQHGGTGKSKLVNHIESNENNNVIMEFGSDTYAGYKVPPSPIVVNVVDNEPTDDETNENNTEIMDSGSDTYTGYKVPPPPIAVSAVDN